MWLVGSEENYRRPISKDVRNPKSEAIVVHEHIHFLQTTMTGYGHDTWQYYRYLMYDVFLKWINWTSNKENRKLPYAYLATESLNDLALTSYDNFVIKEMLIPICLRNNCPSQIKIFNDLDLVNTKGEWPLNPEIEFKGKSYSLQGLDIIESHAKYLESLYSFMVNNIPFSESVNTKSYPKKYWLAKEWFYETIGMNNGFEFSIISDLALQTKIIKPPDSEKEWQDTHPAWRFIKLTEALRDGAAFHINTPQEAVQGYDRFCNRLLKACNYKSLDEVLDKAISGFEPMCEGCDIRGFLELEKRMREPLLFRKNVRWSGANPFFDMKVWIHMKKNYGPISHHIGDKMMIPFYENDEFPESYQPMPNLMMEIISELHLHAIASQILGRYSDYNHKNGELQCGYRYYGISKGCLYQVSGQCDGSFTPKNGLPIEIKVINSQEIKGCTLGMLFSIHEVDVEHLDINFTHELPPLEEVNKILAEKK